MSSNHDAHSLETIAVHGGLEGMDPTFGSASPPIYQTSTFSFPTPEEGAARFAGESDGFIYTRIGNPTIRALERAVAELEGAAACVAVGSGMAAVSNIYLATLSAGDHMIGSSAVYGPSRVVMESELSRFGVTSSFIDTGDLDAIKAAWTPNTKLLYLETPANPTMRLSDIQACSDLAHERGAVVCVDNTFCSPILQRPFEHGADYVLHSTTKFLNGHTDVVGGVLLCREPKNAARIRKMMTLFGACMDPHQAWLVLRGLRTLHMRVRTAQENAQQVASMLAAHKAIEWIKYPGLPGFEQQAIMDKQMAGPGALMSFGLTGGLEAGRTMLKNVKLATLAVSLGGIETLIQHPASMTHSGMTSAARAEAGITDGLVRLSVGCEGAADIIADLEQALNAL